MMGKCAQLTELHPQVPELSDLRLLVQGQPGQLSGVVSQNKKIYNGLGSYLIGNGARPVCTKS